VSGSHAGNSQTGVGTGNISTDCAALLHSRGHEVWVLSRGKNRVPPQYRTLVADRKDPASMATALGTQTFDSVVNFIGYNLLALPQAVEAVGPRGHGITESDRARRIR